MFRWASRQLIEYRFVIVTILLTSVFANSGANAQLVATSDEPLDITSERLERVEEVTTWTGNVQVVQGEALLTTDKLVIFSSNESSVDEIHARGDVRYSNGSETISGDEAVYDEQDRSLTMTGRVVVTQGKQIMRGGKLVYWVDTGKIRFTAPEGRRIRGLFYTKSVEDSS